MKPTLAKYEPTFEIDDGFRLTNEPTLDALCNDVRKWYDFALRGADMHLLGAFLCGVSLIRAKKRIPAAPRGRSGKGYNRDGFDAWKRTAFPECWERTLGRYMQFASGVFELAVSKKDTLSFLENGPESFELPRSREDVAELMREIGEVMTGKTMCELYRSIKRLREPMDPRESGAMRGNRETWHKGQAFERDQRKWVVQEWGDEAKPGYTKTRLLTWLAPDVETKVKPYLLLETWELDEFAELLRDLLKEINEVRAARRGGKA